MRTGDLEGYGETEISQSMFVFHFVSCVRKTIAVTGCVVSVCKKEGPEATEKYEHRNE